LSARADASEGDGEGSRISIRIGRRAPTRDPHNTAHNDRRDRVTFQQPNHNPVQRSETTRRNHGRAVPHWTTRGTMIVIICTKSAR